MDNDSAQNEWELSKENVQPLRSGRKVLSLNESLLQSSDRLSQIREEKHAFESELRTYSGDDPLDVWYRYIRWTEETFPKVGKDSNFTTIVERCIRQFKDEENYRNDERYIYAWMRMADVCNVPLDIYDFMYDQNIGCELSCFFDSWASILEQLGHTKKADTIYQEGLKRNARPYESLKSKHEEFQKRVARGILRGQENVMEIEEPGGQRQVLSQLKTRGSKHQAPISRIGESVKGSAGVLGGARPKTVQQVAPKGIQIYCDENQAPGSLQPQTGAYASVPHRAVTNKENEKKAGIWKNQKMKTSSVSVPISEVNSYQQPKFTVHVDEETPGQPLRTPAKMPEMGNKILSARKADNPTMTNYLKNMSIPSENKNEKPMYCKDKIYCGAEEYSFEEIRAVRWVRRQEQKQKEAENEEYEKKLEENRLALLEETERIRQQRMQLQQEEQAMLEAAERKRQEHLEQIERDSVAQLQKQQQMIEASIQKRLQEQMVMSQKIGNKSVRQLFDDSNQGNQSLMENLTGPTGVQRQNSSTNLSMNSSRGTPSSQPINTSIPRSAESFDKVMSGAPSPTVNMKEAMNIVLGMFNASLEMNKPKPEENDIDMTEPSFHAPPHNTGLGGPAPFSIFCDDGQQKPVSKPAAPAPAAAPFTIFMDENSEGAQSVTKRRGGLGLGSRQDRIPAPQSHKKEPAVSEDVVMLEESTRSTTTRALFDEDNIESQPRDDLTLAPVGSHLSFVAAARVASTPHHPNTSGQGSGLRGLDISDVEMPEEEVEPPKPKPKTPESKDQDKLEHTTAGNTSNTSSSSFHNLSPIMEGSSEDSGAHSKSSNHHTTIEPPIMPRTTLTPVMDQSDDTASLLQALDENDISEHVVDTTTYIPPEMDEKTENLLSTSICIVDPKDPFDSESKEKFLQTLKKPLLFYENFNGIEDCMPEMKKGSFLNFGMDVYRVLGQIGEGGFAKVYLAEADELDMVTCEPGTAMDGQVAIKVETPAQKWEFYICSVLQERMAQLNDVFDARPAVMKIRNGYFFQNGSCIVTDFQPYGTMLEFVNKCKTNRSKSVSEQLEPAITYMTIELLHIVENMHRCHIIHGDIKPDNFLILQLPQVPVSSDPGQVFGGSNRFCQLIDFGQGIDMTKYPDGTTFLAKVDTKCFQCIEMKTNRPWTYQTDLFGLAGTIHVLIFQQYMKVYQTRGEWKMTSTTPRSWNTDLWKRLFHILLNITSCGDLPDLSVIRREFEQYFVNNLLDKYNQQCLLLNKTIEDMAKRITE